MKKPNFALFLSLCLMGLLSLAADSLSDTILSHGPTAYWRFGETSGNVAYDSSGNGLHGSYVGSYSLGASGTVETNGALRVNGGYMQASAPITPSFTILVWGKSVASTWDAIGWLASARVPNGFILHPDAGSTRSVGMYIIDNTSGAAYTRIGAAVPSDITTWHQYGISYNAVTQIASVILDGQIIATTTYTGTRTTSSATMTFGVDQHDPNNRMGNGWIDEVSLYNKELTAGQIFAQYNAATNPVPEPTSFLLLALASLSYVCFLRKERKP